MSILSQIPANSVTYKIDSSYTEIYGESEKNYAFISSCDTLESFSFGEDPQLQIIRQFAFYNCSKLKSINLKPCTCLLSIGSQAFYQCSSVTSLELPDSLTSIGSNCFGYSKITSVVIPSQVTKLSEQVFRLCGELQTITFASDTQLKTIEYQIIISTKIENFTVPSRVTEISNGAFEYANSLKNIFVEEQNEHFVSDNGVLYSAKYQKLLSYPIYHGSSYSVHEGCETIGYASLSSAQLFTVTLCDSINTIENYAFQSTKLSSITLPNSIKNIYPYAFNECSSLSEVVLSSQLTELSSYMFAKCGFTEFTVPAHIQIIGSFCFFSCNNLMKVTLPRNLTTLEGGAFSKCPNEIVIQFEEGSDFMVFNRTLIMNTDETELVQYFGSEANDIVYLPETVTTIKAGAFHSCSNIIGVIVNGENQIKTIENSAFYECTSLHTFSFESVVTIENEAFYKCPFETLNFDALETIGDSSFASCQQLKSINFSESLTSIGQKAFAGCTELSTILIPEKLEEIGQYCFTNCSKLHEINKFPSTLHTIGSNAFENNKAIEFLNFSNSVNLVNLSSSLFLQCSELSKILLPSSIEYIGSFCFSGTKISEITIPTETVQIGDYCFSNCKYLTNFTIPQDSKLTDIGFKTFLGCSSLRTIESYSNNFVIDNSALYSANRSQLLFYPQASANKIFCFSDQIKYVSPSAFLGCTNLEIITIPDNSVTEIGFSAFEGCTNLHSINIPSTVKIIGENAFLGCNKLRCGLTIEVTDQEKVKQWITKSNLPARCVLPCSQKTCETKRNIHYLAFSIIFLLYNHK